MSVSDCHFPSIFGEDEDQSMELMGDYENWLNEHFGYSQTAHQIGGYPDFTQEDPRFDPQYQDYILLLQIDTEYISETHSICWGDAGIGNFFINPDDLRNLDFSRVLYQWCVMTSNYIVLNHNYNQCLTHPTKMIHGYFYFWKSTYHCDDSL